MGFAPTWLRQVSPPLLHKTTLTIARQCAKSEGTHGINPPEGEVPRLLLWVICNFACTVNHKRRHAHYVHYLSFSNPSCARPVPHPHGSVPFCQMSLTFCRGVDPGGWGLLNSLKIRRGQSMFWHPEMSHSFIQNCCWIALQVSHHPGWKTCQKLKVKLIFRGAWNSLMAWPDWPWSHI